VKLLLATALVLMLSSAALAASETRQLGPYTVSFDLNTNMNYQVQTSNPASTASATVYSMRILTDNNTGAGISIIENKDLTDSTASTIKQLVAMGLALSGINTTNIVDLTIDGKSGFVAMGVPYAAQSNMPSELYRAVYWLDSVDCTACGPVSVGKTSVDISSTYPQDVTQNLLKSIHVAMGQAPA
jgi:hypothetical protein